MSKYREWMLQQEPDFITEVCANYLPSNKFKDYNLNAITLEELKQLDNKYINKESETL